MIIISDVVGWFICFYEVDVVVGLNMLNVEWLKLVVGVYEYIMIVGCFIVIKKMVVVD